MTDLMQALFQYAQEHRLMGWLYCNSEYSNAAHCAAQQEKQLRTGLSPQQTTSLNHLLEEQNLVRSIELEAVFRLGFSMALELSR